MLTVADWCRALLQERSINIQSSPWLIDKVWPGTTIETATLHGRRPAPIWDRPYTVQIQPVEVLHAIGRMTTPPEPVNLLDIASTWAYYRYLWAFAPAPIWNGLYLSSYVADIDSHQKTVMSDELGVGFAGIAIERLLKFGSPRDVLPLLASGSIPGMYAHGKRTPDYLCEALLEPGRLAVVECKGTQTSGYVYEQLRSGAEQVCGLAFPAPCPHGFVVATDLSTQPITVNIIHFPGDDPNALPSISNRGFADAFAATWAARLGRFLGHLARVAQEWGEDRLGYQEIPRQPIVLDQLNRIVVDDSVYAVRRQTAFTIGQFEVTVSHGIADSFVPLLERTDVTFEEVQATVQAYAKRRADQRLQSNDLRRLAANLGQLRNVRATPETFVTPGDRADRFEHYDGQIPQNRERVEIAHLRDDGTLLQVTIQQ